MLLLYKKLFRDIRQTRGQFIAILAVITVGVAFYTGLNTTLRNLSDISGKYFSEYRLADATALFFKAPENIVQEVQSLPYVKQAEGRLVKDTKINISDSDAIVRIITLPDSKRDIPNDIMLRSGRYFSPGDLNQCIVEEEFFKAHSLKIGGFIEPMINGSRVKLRITGTAKTPEYVYLIRDASEFAANTKKFGIVYIKKTLGQYIFGYRNSVNEITVLFDNGVTVDRGTRELKDALKKYEVVSVVKKGQQLSYETFMNEIDSLKAMGKVFPLVFFLVASLIIYITMSRIIDNQRNQMGVLMALGYSDPQIFLHYVSYASIVGIIGSVTGSLAGFQAGSYMLSLYNTMYKIPYSSTTVQFDLILQATLLTLFFCIAAGFNSCRIALGAIPAEAMRPKAPVAGRMTLAERIRPLWKRLNFSWKMITRNLFRYKKRSLLTCVGILSSCALLLAGLGMMDSMRYLMNLQYPSSQTYDIKVCFSRFTGIEELAVLKNIVHVAAAEPVVELGAELSKGWIKKNIGFTMLSGSAEIYNIIDNSGNAVKQPANGILLPEKLGKQLGIEIGDRVKLKALLPGRDKTEKKAVVRGYLQQYLGQSATCEISETSYYLDQGGIMNGAVLKLDSPESERYVTGMLKKMPNVDTITSKKSSRENLQKMLDTLLSMIVFIIAAAAILAFAVVYNITSINILERRREIATLKVLGFNDREMRQIVFNENLIITFAGILAGIPAGQWLLGFIMSVSGTDTLSFPARLDAPSYAVAALAAFGFTFLTNIMLFGKLESIDMVESLKSAE